MGWEGRGRGKEEEGGGGRVGQRMERGYVCCI